MTEGDLMSILTLLNNPVSKICKQNLLCDTGAHLAVTQALVNLPTLDSTFSC